MAERRRIPETLFDDLGFRMTYEVKRVIYELQTEHQHLVLFEHPFFGKMLMLDGATQVTTVDEFVYHEMMSHVPLLAHGHAEEVLIVGGGDCGVAEEVLKHKSVKRLTQVEIDASVIEFSKRHFPEFTKPVFADKRFDLIIADGMKYITKTRRRFDVIIVDSTDPLGPGKVLFSQKLIGRTHRGHRQLSQAVRGRLLLRRGNSHIRGRPFGDRLGHRQRQITPRFARDDHEPLRQGRPISDKVLDARSARGSIRAAALHCREGGERNAAAVHGRAGRRGPSTQREGVSFPTSKLSSISTLFGSVTKICRRVLFGTSLTRNATPLRVRCCLIASNPRLPNAI